MNIDSYKCMKTTFDFFVSEDFHPCMKPLFVIAYDEHQDYIDSGWVDAVNVCNMNMLYVTVDYDEALHFNKKIYEEKIAELQLMIKQKKVNKKLQAIEGDFV